MVSSLTLPTDTLIPGSDRDGFQPIYVLQSFQDPANSFRAQSVTEMAFIVPAREEFSKFTYDVGIEPQIRSVIFSIQNRTINARLRVTLTIPPYLRSNLGTEFVIAPKGSEKIPPINIGPRWGPSPEGAEPFDGPLLFTTGDVSTGRINVTLIFSEEQAKTLDPGIIVDQIIFDIFPDPPITGPIFVDTRIQPPGDLNTIPEDDDGDGEDIPVDGDGPVTGSDEPEVVTITEFVTQSVEIPVLGPGFVAGADGITNDGEPFVAGDLVEGPPPTGWTTEADGRAYPPIIPDTECDPTGEPGADVPDEELTPLQLLVRQSQDIAPSFGTATRRRGFLIEPDLFLEGVDPTRVTRTTPLLVVADIVPGRNEFKIIATSPDFRNGTPINRNDPFTAEYFNLTQLHTSVVKEGERIPYSFRDFRNWALSTVLDKIVNRGDRLEVPGDLSSPRSLQNFRVLATAASLVVGIQNDGSGNPVD